MHLFTGSTIILPLPQLHENIEMSNEETTTIKWTRTFNEPERYGEYLVKGNGLPLTFAHFDHPVGCRETGWYVKNDMNDSEWEKIDPHYWAEIPE